jgi:hypothetical protein
MVLLMDLVTSSSGKIGRLMLVHRGGERVLGDPNILHGEFRHSLCRALERCVISMPKDFSEEGNEAVAHHP